MNDVSISSKEANRDNDLHAVDEQEAARFQLDLRKFLFIDRARTSRSRFPTTIFVSFAFSVEICFLSAVTEKKKKRKKKKKQASNQNHVLPVKYKRTAAIWCATRLPIIRRD